MKMTIMHRLIYAISFFNSKVDLGGSGGWGESYHHIGVGGTNNDDLLRKCKIIEEEMEKSQGIK
jgi:hypothetical protein